MPLLDVYQKTPSELADVHVQRIVGFAGKLSDGTPTSRQLRDYLAVVETDVLTRYAGECLDAKFDGNGFTLQDIVNTMGQRLGFEVTFGRYRGAQGQLGFDGLWIPPGGKAMIVEVKTTDAYRIDLEVIAGYRRSLARDGRMAEDNSSMLIVVGREDTGDLEAQIRGSRYAWDMRLISVDALARLVKVKEDLEDPGVVDRICGILTPQEFTRVDSIIDLVFATAEEVGEERGPEPADDSPVAEKSELRFREACIRRVEPHIGQRLVKRSRSLYATADGSTVVVCAVSRRYESAGGAVSYFFSFHSHQKETLEKAQRGYVGFGCGSDELVVLIPFERFDAWLQDVNPTERQDGKLMWNMTVDLEDGRPAVRRRKGLGQIPLGEYLVGSQPTETGGPTG